MKIGEKPPSPPPGAVGPEVEESAAPGRGETFAERIASPAQPAPTEAGAATAPGEVSGPAAVAAPAAPSAAGFEDLARAVDRGELSAEQAVRHVVDRVLAAQLPPEVDPETRQRVRALVELSLRNDPLMGALVRRLEGVR